MPIYEYEFTHEDGAIERFELMRSISARDEPAPAPSGAGFGKRIPSLPGAVIEGLTAAEKRVGTTNNRREWGKYMKDNREKRKKNYSPTTREGSSNELWVGNEVKDGVIAAPTEKQLAGIRPMAPETPQQTQARKESAKEAAAAWAKKDAGKRAELIS
jgi:hypothetical protein